MRNLRRPSPALVISIVALFVALGGTGYAAITITGKQVQDSSLTGKDVKNKSLTKRDFKGSVRGPHGATGPVGAKGDSGAKGDPGVSATRLWAVVNTNGTLQRGSNVASTGKLSGLGNYQVLFNQDISGCEYSVNVGGADITSSTGIASAVRRLDQPTGVQVSTSDFDGAQADRSFHLAVHC